jgi:hypothetical protein
MKPIVHKYLLIIIGIVVGSLVTICMLLLFTPIFASDRMIKHYPIDLASVIKHSHSKVDVQNGQVAPTLVVDIFPDKIKIGNYSLKLKTTDFIFSPEHVSSSNVFGEGHAHVYIDDVLIARAYSEWFHIPKLKSGKHKIYITLNQNDHKEYSINGKTIGFELEVDVNANNPEKMKM